MFLALNNRNSGIFIESYYYLSLVKADYRRNTDGEEEGKKRAFN